MLSGFETKNPGNNIQINDNYRNLVLRQTGVINLNNEQRSGAYGEIDGYYYADVSYPNPVSPVIAIQSRVSTFLVRGAISGNSKIYTIAHAFFATDAVQRPQGIRYFIFDVPRQQDLPNPQAGIVIKNPLDEVAFTTSPMARYMKVIGTIEGAEFDALDTTILNYTYPGDVKVAICPVVQRVFWSYEYYEGALGRGWFKITYCSMGSCPSDKIVRLEQSTCGLAAASPGGPNRNPYPMSLVIDVSSII